MARKVPLRHSGYENTSAERDSRGGTRRDREKLGLLSDEEVKSGLEDASFRKKVD